MNGTPIQMFVTIAGEQRGPSVANHSTGSMPTLSRVALISPKRWLNMNFHAKALTNDGTAQGTISSTR